MYRLPWVFMALLHLYACKKTSNPRSVNLALETVLEFNNNDNSADVHIIDKVRRFLDKIKLVIDTKKSARRTLTMKDLKFTDLLKNAIEILMSYDDDDLKDFVSAMDDEMRKYHYKGCKFYELIENSNVRKFVAEKMDEIKKASVKSIKQMLEYLLKALSEDDLERKQRAFVDNVDSLYDSKSSANFRKFLRSLALYKTQSVRSKTDLVKIIRTGIRSIIFDHYSGLDFKTRRDFKVKLEKFWKDHTNPGRTEHHVWQFETSNKGGISGQETKELSLESPEKRLAKDYQISKTANRPQNNKKQKNKLKKSKSANRLRARERYEYDTEISVDVNRDVRKKPATKERLTFITLYPEEISLEEAVKPREKSTTAFQRARIHTLWEEKHKRPRMRSREKPKKNILSEHQTNIEVFKERPHVYDRRNIHMATKLESRPYKRTWDDDEYEKPKKTHKKGSSKHQQLGRSWQTERKSRQFFKPTTTANSDEGISIDSYEIKNQTFRKSNINDSFIANSTVSFDNITTDSRGTQNPDANVIKRLSALEDELEVVKARIDKKTDYVEIPNYGQLDFWAGTTKDSNPKTTKTHVTKSITTKSEKTTTTKKVTTPTTMKTTKKSTTKATKKSTTVQTTSVSTTKIINKYYNYTDYPMFRSQNITSAFKNNDYTTRKEEGKISKNKVPEKKVPEKNFTETSTSVTEPRNLSNVSNALVFNDSLNIEDDINEIGVDTLDNLSNVNITSPLDLVHYFNETKGEVDNKTHVVRKKMLEDLKSVLSDLPDEDLAEDNNNSTNSTAQNLPITENKVSDPFEFTDDADLLK